MNLYLVIQWGNERDGGNGHDNQCLVRAESFESAIKLGEDHLRFSGWKEGKSDSVILLGNDLAKEQKEEVINIFWCGVGFARGKYERWNYDTIGKKWMTDKKWKEYIG